MNDVRVEELKALLPRTMTHDWVRLGSRLVRLLRDRLHAAQHDAILDRLLTQARQSVELSELRRLHVPTVTYPPDLPITARKDEIVAAIRANQVVVIAGETGSGKTTQIPKMCLEAGLGIEAKVGCTQPRRVAALSISQRIAEELNVRWGREVGCKIRFDDHSSSETYLKLMTDGILLAETQGDPLLSDYNALIIDEAHERSLNIDFLLGYLKGLLARRPDLKLIVTSATIDTQAFSRHFGNAPIIEVSGRMFPVEVIYAPFDHEADTEEWEESRREPAREETAAEAGAEFQSAANEPAESRAISSEALQLTASIRASLRAGGGELTYVDAAVRATDAILYESSFGDVLIFMPGERDIRETSDHLEGRFGREAEIVPLYGRLSAGDQQRVFASSSRRKIVIATNIAETSLTIPGIRYVVDAGLARISRYAARTRTKRLPVEPISQSSANQRKGRAGRVQDGVCVRLYSEEDFRARPPFTQPEIQRANLAEVILRMKAFRLGDIETFAFVQPPSPVAIQAGYGLLQELGALDAARELTPLGRDLARLPIDPTLGRMLLQAQQEHATRELLIIAAGLSIQDPRERPLDQRDAADAAHRRFVHPQSDFLALLNVWKAVHDQWEELRTQNTRRKFCKQHFLSYLRMREWQDLHAQLEGALENLGVFQDEEGRGSAESGTPTGKAPRTDEQFYQAIHRSILAGLLGHVATREERNQYKAAGNRQVMIFPGSALFERGEKPPRDRFAKPGKTPPAPKPKSNQPQWLVAGEVVETSQLFARTVAGIDPHWIVQLAPHLCQVTHQHPHWSAAAGRVLVEEITRFQGFEVLRRKVAYGNLNPDDATAIFIRSALVEEDLEPPVRGRGVESDEESAKPEAGSWKWEARREDAASAQRTVGPGFLAHNRRVREKVESWQTRLRRHDLGDLDEALFKFYAGHLKHISSRDELLRWLREPGRAESLCATENDLSGGRDLTLDTQAFPDVVEMAGQAVPLNYAYAPGEEHDGVTIRLPVTLAEAVTPALLEWSVPGLRAAMMDELLRSLPKSLRKELLPIDPKVQEIVRDFRPAGSSFHASLARFLSDRYGVNVPPEAWRIEGVPVHLRPRVELVGNNSAPVASGRDFAVLKQGLAQVKLTPPTESSAWKEATRRWERAGLTTYSCGELPEKVQAGDQHGLPVWAYPGLSLEDGSVAVRLFPNTVAAQRASLPAWQRLVEMALAKDFAWLERDLRGLARFDSLASAVGGVSALQETALPHLKRHVLPAELPSRLTLENFNEAVAASKRLLPGLAQQLIDRVGQVLQFRTQAIQRVGVGAPAPAAKSNQPLKSLAQLNNLGALLTKATSPVTAAAPSRPTGFAAEVEALVPKGFLLVTPFVQLPHLPRYLKGLMLRIERAANNPPKDAERAKLVAPYVIERDRLLATPPKSPAAVKLAEEFRWLLEEYKVSVFAQELGTAQPASAKRLDELLEKIRSEA